MATNSARGNPIGAPDGPQKEGPPPPAVSPETKATVQNVSTSGSTGTHASGQDAGAASTAPAKVKTEKELEKERKKAEKLAKFQQKKTAAQAAPAAAPSKAKEKKEKKEEEVLPEYVEETTLGEKKQIKSFDDPYYKAYNPVAVESAWGEWWEKQGFYKPQLTAEGKVKPEGSFVIVVPPPNVTGALHMGHALGNSLEDILTRWQRMLGKTTLWLPGTDHAGIATQSVVEKMLWRRTQQTRHDLGREKFVETVWDWKEEYHKRITNAFRKMGCSLDWSREAFTMDENLTAAVKEHFVRLHEEKIIYRANRLVNWCSALSTALSNLEVENKELSGRTLLDVPGYDKKVEFGVIIHFQYPIEGSDEKIEVATTRIETMLGDTGIAVHPDDKRYTHLVGKYAVHPFIEGRKLPIVADSYVDMEFGTGAVKLTPAHDPNDFNLGQKHNLEFINILTDDGLMNDNAGPYKGQKRFDVRYTLQDDLKKLGLYVDKKDNPMKVPRCERSKDVIEPRLKKQWWMKMRGLADEAVKAVQDGEIKIRPESAEKMYFRWMADIQDWCISRQLWWGHRAPVYKAIIEGQNAEDSDDDNLWFSGRSREEAEEKAKKALPGKTFVLEQDPDVLDTWFSSGLWPFSTMGWPKQTKDLENFYPTSLLETGWDIMFFWVARMIMLGIKLTGKVPFREVYAHSLIRDSEGRKMSKSLGNVIDPLDVIRGITLDDLHAKLLTGNLAPGEVKKATAYQKSAFPQGIPECGADALRMTLAAYTTGGSDINFDIKVMHSYRRFANKIYQASKYVLGKLDSNFVPQKTRTLNGKESLAELWILSKMNSAAGLLNETLEEREFMRAANGIYGFIYNSLCDTFIENSKAILQEGNKEEQESTMQTLYSALEASLLLIHPFMPYVTEELWQRLPRRPEDDTPSIMLAKYPVYEDKLHNVEAESAYQLVLDCAQGIRSLKAEFKEAGQVFIQAYNDGSFKTATEQVTSIKSLSGKGVTSIDVLSSDKPRPQGCVAFPVGSNAAVFLHVKGLVDLDAEITKAAKKLEKTRANIDKQRKMVTDPGYLEKVAVATQQQDKQKLVDLETEAKGFEGTIEQFKQLKLE
ncbi:putative valyl-trna synthetase protein [Phaeoacremonium minimum UCRPA7]|uniref:valine--tRNA ligase n=1 Tax=Phaeoacremonium minimum (strain UCR-PA7) TaxID=1286976 RepID=R8BF19_PHAM7|nr:putative valyl-trna synthetase protein [Phaeoacremonium minimum UCRPA7]EON97887.1 putative valyl-trna synthetase protein [Phaeoacremonium minimum UCRPA7]